MDEILLRYLHKRNIKFHPRKVVESFRKKVRAAELSSAWNWVFFGLLVLSHRTHRCRRLRPERLKIYIKWVRSAADATHTHSGTLFSFFQLSEHEWREKSEMKSLSSNGILFMVLRCPRQLSSIDQRFRQYFKLKASSISVARTWYISRPLSFLWAFWLGYRKW